ARPIKAYAGGISLGFQDTGPLVEEARALVAQGYRALKLRFGDTVQRDIMRLAAIRKAFGAEIDIMADANTGYQVDDVRRVMPALVEHDVLWLEEPFAPHDHRSYATAAG